MMAGCVAVVLQSAAGLSYLPGLPVRVPVWDAVLRHRCSKAVLLVLYETAPMWSAICRGRAGTPLPLPRSQ